MNGCIGTNSEVVPTNSPQLTVYSRANVSRILSSSSRLCVRNVVEDERGAEPLLEIDTHGQVTCLRFMDGRLYAGLVDGRLVIYNRDRGSSLIWSGVVAQGGGQLDLIPTKRKRFIRLPKLFCLVKIKSLVPTL